MGRRRAASTWCVSVLGSGNPGRPADGLEQPGVCDALLRSAPGVQEELGNPYMCSFELGEVTPILHGKEGDADGTGGGVDDAGIVARQRPPVSSFVADFDSFTNAARETRVRALISEDVLHLFAVVLRCKLAAVDLGK